MTNQPPETVWIECIGSDGNQHRCEPKDSAALCGMPVLRKDLLSQDCLRNTCLECAFLSENY